MPNRLIHETSPYLRQHAENPVDWYPWGEEAFRKAVTEDKPILLSIGYSACHWCHVMERESFEDPETARLMNELFVNIKVDREERPDLDTIYMDAVQAMTGHGGWPMTVFLTPQGKPFYGGTYFPPTPRHGMPAFRDVLRAVAEAYHNRKAEVFQQAERLTAHLQQTGLASQLTGSMPTDATLDQAFRALQSQFDFQNGGFGTAPKFPQPMAIEFLLRTWRRTGDRTALAMAERTLQKMARGGIYDQIGGGFHRYAVDAHWLVPHFEKMLYDNAQLASVYLHAYQATRDPFYARIARETLDYVRRELTSPVGGFYSTQDADSEGVEGQFYVWTPQEIMDVLGPLDGPIVMQHYGVTEHGNFEGKNVLHVARDVDVLAQTLGLPVDQIDAALARGRAALAAHRARRPRPARDEKILTAWNGLMIRAFAEGGRVLDRPDDLELALASARFLLDNLVQDGHLLRTYKDGQAKIHGYLEDYALFADGLLALYSATLDVRWFEQVEWLAAQMIDLFWDDEQGGFFDTARGTEPLIARPKSFVDHALPSGNAVAADLFLRLAVLTGEASYRQKAETVLTLMREAMARYPTAFGRLLGVLDFALAVPVEVAIVGEPTAPSTRAMLQVLASGYLPNSVVAGRAPRDEMAMARIALLAERPPIDGQTTAYVCQQFTCLPPTTDPAELAAQLGVAPPRP